MTQALKSVEAHDFQQRVNPITASIIQGALENIAIEMGYKLMRMSYSSIIRESEDFGAALCDTQGRQLCECSKSTPLQSGPIPGYVKGILKEFKQRGSSFKPGDVIIHSDPYNGASHSPDIGFCVPVFYSGELIGFSVTTAHHLDIGSCQPGSVGVVVCADAYSEGLRFRALKVYDEGRRNEALWQMIGDNVRVSNLVIGDMDAQIAACHVGARRLVDLVERYGLATLSDAVEDLFDYSERLMRAQIEKVPDGVYTATGYIDGFLEVDDPAVRNLPVEVTVTVEGSGLKVDLTGSADQVNGYAINMPFRGTVDVAIWLTLRSILLDSEVFGNIPQNDGLFRPIDIVAPLGCIANPIFPAPTIARFAPGNVVADTVMKALAAALPKQVCAGVANLKAVTFSGMENNQQWVHIEIFEGSYGGRFGKDGMDCVDTLYANTRNNPIEDIESHVPLRVTEYQFRENACAPGKWRGGLNSVKELCFLTDGGISVEGDGHAHAPWGFSGGSDGLTSSLLLTREGEAPVELSSMMATMAVRKGDRIKAIGGIGGGYGNPLERPAESVLENVLDGYFDIETASRDFGVVITTTGMIDAQATQQLRST
ncbi:MAG: hydantoinase B/oxoprolinase family protein [Xanthomonadales bacterium]|nr:hydantoinase B/oxoprolinase family protein [Xanthomonadales bacterium]